MLVRISWALVGQMNEINQDHCTFDVDETSYSMIIQKQYIHPNNMIQPRKNVEKEGRKSGCPIVATTNPPRIPQKQHPKTVKSGFRRRVSHAGNTVKYMVFCMVFCMWPPSPKTILNSFWWLFFVGFWGAVGSGWLRWGTHTSTLPLWRTFQVTFERPDTKDLSSSQSASTHAMANPPRDKAISWQKVKLKQWPEVAHGPTSRKGDMIGNNMSFWWMCPPGLRQSNGWELLWAVKSS